MLGLVDVGTCFWEGQLRREIEYRDSSGILRGKSFSCRSFELLKIIFFCDPSATIVFSNCFDRTSCPGRIHLPFYVKV